MKIGDVVRLKSGGPFMTVAAEKGPDSVALVWWDHAERSLREAVLPMEALSVVGYSILPAEEDKAAEPKDGERASKLEDWKVGDEVDLRFKLLSRIDQQAWMVRPVSWPEESWMRMDESDIASGRKVAR